MAQNNIILYQNDIPNDMDFGDEISIDTETMGLNLKRDRLCLMQIKPTNTHLTYLIQFNNNYNAPNLKKILSNKNIVKIFHYARFDLLAIYEYLNVQCSNIFCTKIASKLCRTYTDRHSLQILIKELLNIDVPKEQQSSNWGNTILSQDQLSYAANDVIYLSKLKSILEEMLIQENRIELAYECFKFLQHHIILDKLDFINIFNH